MASKVLKLAGNSVANVLGFGISIVLGIISYPLIIQSIGLEAFGIFALIMAVLAPMDLTNLGFAEAAIKYVSQFSQKGDQDKVREYISTTLFMSILVGLVGMVIIYFVGPSVAYRIFHFESESFETIQTCFGLVAVGWLIRQVTSVFLSVPTALQQFRMVGAGHSLSSIVTTVSILSVLWYEQTILGYALGTLVGACLSLIVWWVIARMAAPGLRLVSRFHRDVWKSSFSYGGWQTLGSLGSLITNQTDKYVLGIYLSAGASGVYNVILQVQQRILSALWKVAEVLFPLFSAASDEDSASKFAALIRSNFMITALGVLVFFPFVVLAHPILELWISKDFADQGYIVMKCLLLIGVFAMVTVSQTFFLMGNGKVRDLTVISYFTGAFTLFGSLVFIPMYGLNGAGYGTLFAAVTRLLLFYFIMKRFLGHVFDGRDYLVASLLPVIPGIAVLFLPAWHPSGWIALLAMYAGVTLFIATGIWISLRIVPRADRHYRDTLRLGNEIISWIRHKRQAS